MDVNEILRDYQNLPEYSELPLLDVHQVSLFGDKPINIAATRCSVDELVILLSCGADINNAGEHGYTPLHNAVEQGHVETIEWLLAHGADKTARNEAGETPLELAQIMGEKRIEQMLACACSNDKCGDKGSE